MGWLTDIRKVALLACVTSVAVVIAPLWSAMQLLIGLGEIRAAPEFLLLLLISALPIVFYFALYRDEGSLQISARLRLLARAAAFILGAFLAFQSVEWIKSPIGPFTNFLGALSTVANILLLAGLARDSGDHAEEPRPVSTLLYSVTKVTVIVWGIWVAFSLFRIGAQPYAYSQISQQAIRVGSDGPKLADMLKEAVQTFVSSSCFFVAPYIIMKSWSSDPPAVAPDASEESA